MENFFSASLLFRYRTGDNQWGFPLCETRKYFAKLVTEPVFDFFNRIGREAECEGCFYKGILSISKMSMNAIFDNDCGPFGIEQFSSAELKIKPIFSLNAIMDENYDAGSANGCGVRSYHAKLLFESSRQGHETKRKRYTYMYFVFQASSALNALNECLAKGIEMSKYGWRFCGIDGLLDGNLFFGNKIGGACFDYWFDMGRLPAIEIPFLCISNLTRRLLRVSTIEVAQKK